VDPLSHLYFYKYRVTVRPERELILPQYKGSLLRGLFGHALKRVICPRKGFSCDDCEARCVCAYSLLMATPVPKDHPHAGKYRYPPRPYVIEPPLTEERYFSPSSLLSFEIVLIGVASEYLPYFVHAFLEMGRRDADRNMFEVLSVGALDVEGKEVALIFNRNDESIRASGRKIEYHFFLGEEARNDTVTIALETPLRIKESERLSRNVSFHLLVERLSERAFLLSHFYCGATMEDFQEFSRDARKVETLESQVRWVDWERYSSRQKTRMRLGGIVGSITYRGDFRKYLPLLRLGEHIHVGKAATFGLGKYRVVMGG